MRINDAKMLEEIDLLRQENQSLSGQKQNAGSKMNKLRKEIDELGICNSDLIEQNQELSKRENDMKTAAEKNHSLENLNEKLGSEVSGLLRDNRALRAKLSKLRCLLEVVPAVGLDEPAALGGFAQMWEQEKRRKPIPWKTLADRARARYRGNSPGPEDAEIFVFRHLCIKGYRYRYITLKYLKMCIYFPTISEKTYICKRL